MEFFLPDGEKRAFPRIRLAIATDIELLDSDQLLEGSCLDISTCGAKLQLGQPLEIGTRLQFSLREHLGLEPFLAIAEVNRVSPGQNSKPEAPSYEVGVKIIRIENQKGDNTDDKKGP